MRTLLAPIYTLYVFLVIAALWIGHFPLTLVLPRVEQRRALARGAMRLAFRLIGCPIRTKGFENLPEGPAIVVANHGSYLDGPLMNALLPTKYAFVIKAEASRTPVIGWYLRRINALFIERSNPWAAGRDGNRLFAATQEGQSLGMFPEGGFSHEDRLKRFKPGAFVAAARANMPVVPAAISGTRRIMHPDKQTLWPSKISVTFLAPLQPANADREAADALRKSAQEQIESTIQRD